MAEMIRPEDVEAVLLAQDLEGCLDREEEVECAIRALLSRGWSPPGESK